MPESADPQCIHELITIAGNLLDNAMEVLKGYSVKEIGLAFYYDRGHLICTVRDSGPGIPGGLREQIFVQGFSTKGEQRGIGLYLVRKSVEKLKGKLQIVDDGKPGTTFMADVPYAVKGDETV